MLLRILQMMEASVPRKPDDVAHVEPLVVRPVVARRLLGNCSEETLWKLINSEAVKSFRDGGARYISTASIKDYLASRLGGTSSKRPTPRRASRKSTLVTTATA